MFYSSYYGAEKLQCAKSCLLKIKNQLAIGKYCSMHHCTCLEVLHIYLQDEMTLVTLLLSESINHIVDSLKRHTLKELNNSSVSHSVIKQILFWLDLKLFLLKLLLFTFFLFFFSFLEEEWFYTMQEKLWELKTFVKPRGL